MSSKKSFSVPPPPVPPQPPRSFAPGLALQKPKIDPYDPMPRTSTTDAYSFLRTDTEDDSASGTWTTIDPDTGARAWDEEHRRQSVQGSSASSIRSGSRATTPAPDSWMQWAVPGTASTTGESSRASSPERRNDADASIDPEVRRLFVDTRDIMMDNTRPTTLFEKRNQKSLAKGNATKIKNMIGGEVVSIVHNPIDDRVKYRDHEGNYVDGIDRGKMKKRYEDEWRSRLDNRAAQMEHLTKIKLAWEALSPAEKARQIERREANAKLVSLLGAGLQSRADLYVFDETPDIYRRTKKWTISLGRPRESSTANSEAWSFTGGYSSDIVSNKTVTDRYNHQVGDRSRDGLPSTSRQYDSSDRETSLGKRRPSDRTNDDSWSSDNGFSLDTPSEDDYLQHYKDRDAHRPGRRPPAGPRYGAPLSGPLDMRDPSDSNRISSVASGKYPRSSIPSQAALSDKDYLPRYDDHDAYRPGKRPPTGPRYGGPPSSPLGMRNSSYHNRTPSVASSGQYSGFSILSQATGKATSIGKASYQSSKATPSVTSETVTVADPALELALLKDLSARKENYDDKDDAMDKFDLIVEVSSKHGRIVQMKLLDLVEYGSSAVSDRIFSGRVQEIQYFPAERMALVVFLVPAHAAAFVRHVKNLREQDEHEYRRLQINAEWYKGLETEAVYPAQNFSLASVLTDDASRVLYISHVSVNKKVQDFADDMKMAFPEKIIVKVDNSSYPSPYHTNLFYLRIADIASEASPAVCPGT
ncbi:hypothetical protein MMC30_002965 [Trapelia coarctata]|nr:hypothetical protein [Trapelia coarctata]